MKTSKVLANWWAGGRGGMEWKGKSRISFEETIYIWNPLALLSQTVAVCMRGRVFQCLYENVFWYMVFSKIYRRLYEGNATDRWLTTNVKVCDFGLFSFVWWCFSCFLVSNSMFWFHLLDLGCVIYVYAYTVALHTDVQFMILMNTMFFMCLCVNKII